MIYINSKHNSPPPPPKKKKKKKKRKKKRKNSTINVLKTAWILKYKLVQSMDRANMMDLEVSKRHSSKHMEKFYAEKSIFFILVF